MAALPIPAVGSVVDGYRFLGGNPNDKKNWELVAAPVPVPKVGEVLDGYRFKGGNPNDQASWEKVSRPSVAEEDKEGFIPALKAGYQSLKGSAALTAGKLGLMDLKEAERYREEREAEARQIFTPTEKGWTEAPITKTAELLGGSLPYMAAPVAAAATVAALPVTGPAALALSLGATGLVSATQFTGTNLARQLDENKKENPNAGLESTNLGTAAAAAIPQAALDIIGMRAIPLVRNLFKSAGKEITEQQAKKIAEQGFRRTVADYTLATGKAAGIEGTTEAGQQFLERLQAGLSIKDASAREEYVDSFIGGAVLGGAISPVGRYIERRGQAKTSEERDTLDALQTRIDAELIQKEQAASQQTAAAPQEARKEQITAERQAVLDKAAAQQAAIDRVVEQQRKPIKPDFSFPLIIPAIPLHNNCFPSQRSERSLPSV